MRLRRLALGLRQVDVASLAGISREQVVRLEAGVCSPSWQTARQIAIALGADPAKLFPAVSDAAVDSGGVAKVQEGGPRGSG